MTGPAARGATVRQGDRLKAWRPLPDEAAACLPYLHRQLAILRPKVILPLFPDISTVEQLLGFRNRLQVMLNWAWQYFTFDRSVRILLEHTTAPRKIDLHPEDNGAA